MTQAIVIGDTSDRFLVGRVADTAAEQADFVAEYPTESDFWVGTLYDSKVDWTAPFIRDQNGEALLNSRLVLGRYLFTVARSAGLVAYLTAAGVTTKVQDWVARRAGANFSLGTQAVEDTQVSVQAGREVREFRLVIQSRNWLPLTLTACEWQGQFFASRGD